MQYSANGIDGSSSYSRRTEGWADTISAHDNGRIEHIGNAAKVLASSDGQVIVRGNVSELVAASDNGRIYCHGQPRKVGAAYSGRIAIDGDPLSVHATDFGNVIVFGTPATVQAARSGRVTIVTPRELGPDSYLRTTDNGSIRILSPGDEPASSTTQYLKRHLDQLFPERESSPRYAAFATLLERNRDEYLPDYIAKG